MIAEVVLPLASLVVGPPEGHPDRGPGQVRSATQVVGALGLVACAALVSGCGGGPNAAGAAADRRTTDSSASVVKRLGAVPIPSSPAHQPVPTATRDHPQFLAIGQAEHVVLPGTRATVSALGPVERTPYVVDGKLATCTIGTISLEVMASTGNVRLAADDFLSRDERGRVVSLAPVGAPVVTATPGHPAMLKVQGRFESGAPELTWRFDDRVPTIWDFNIERDSSAAWRSSRRAGTRRDGC